MDDTNVSALCVSVHAMSHHVVLWIDFNPPEPRVRGNEDVDTVETTNSAEIPARSRALASRGVVRIMTGRVLLTFCKTFTKLGEGVGHHMNGNTHTESHWFINA
jgi:hypothetical protein